MSVKYECRSACLGTTATLRSDMDNIFNIVFPITDPTWIFFVVLVIILFAPTILGRLNIPHIIGMILAGVLVGEHGLNILARDRSFELFGQVGLYYIMFLAGLEMNMENFKAIRGKAITLGLLAFVIPMVFGFFSNVFILKYSLLTSVLLASMYASHTLVAYPIVLRYGISRHRSVSIAVGATAVTDTLTLLVLAIITGLFKGDGLGGLSWMLLIVRVVLVGGLIVFLFPRIGRWFFRIYSNGVVQFIFVLALVFLAAGLMELVGMEGLLGAFIAGLVLNRLIPNVSPLMHHLEFVGNALFIPYFLIGVGMLIDVRVFFGHIESMKVAGVMIVMALLTKWIAAWATQKIFHLKKLERQLIFGLSNAQAAATLAAVLVGYNITLPGGERLLNDDVLNGTIVLILVTCIVSSFSTDRAAKRLALSQAEVEDEHKKGSEENERILISIGNPDTIEHLIGLSLMIRDPKQPDNLVAVNVTNDANSSGLKWRQGRQNLERAAQVANAAEIGLKCVSRYDLNIASGIVHTQKEQEATVVVVGLHRKSSLMDSFFGNLTETLLSEIHREIIIVKMLMPLNTIRRIVVAVPPKAEYEAGFTKWVRHIGHLGSQLGCRVHFFANRQTLGYIERQLHDKVAGDRVRFGLLDSWDDLLMLSTEVNYDHLFVVVSARRGSISYLTSFERLASQISRYFANSSLMVLYPDQFGDATATQLQVFADPMAGNINTSPVVFANLKKPYSSLGHLLGKLWHKSRK